jgi:hypothetical protein
MHMRVGGLLAMFVLVMACAAKEASSGMLRQSARSEIGVACRAMEVHTDATNRMSAVVFHQADDASREALTAFLHAHSGDAVEVEVESTESGRWRGTVFRLKSCFGRGLLLLPAPAPPLKEGTRFRLRVGDP